MSCVVTANINGNTIEIPINESSANGAISSQSIQKLTELVKYIKSDEEIIHSLYTSEQNLELKKTNSDFISDKIFSKTTTSIGDETPVDVEITNIAEKIKKLFTSLTKGIDIYTSNIDNDVQSLKIYNKKILIINPNLIEHNGLKLLDALINLNVDNESVSNKIEKAKELFNKKIVERYTQYLYEQEVSQNIYLQDFASINVVKYKQSIEYKNVFYNQELTSGSNPVPGDIIHKVIKQGDVETYEDYLYLGLSGEASNYHVLLKIVGNKIDSSQIYIEKILDKVLIYKPRLPYNYNFPTEHDIYTLNLDQKAIPKNVKHSISKGDIIKSSNKRNAPTYVVIDIILNDYNDEEYLVYNPGEQFKYIKKSDEIKIISQNSKLVFKTMEFFENNYQTIINLKNTDIAYTYFKLLKPDDVIEVSDEETKYKIIQVNTDNTLQVISLDEDAERKKVKLEDVKKIYFKNYVKIDRDLNMLNVPLEFFKRSGYESPFLNKFAKLHNYVIKTNGSNVSFYEPMSENIKVEKQVYDLGNYKKLDIPQDQILNELMVDDIICKEDDTIRTKKFYKVVSKVEKDNTIHVNVAMINDNNKYEIFELSQEFFNNIIGIGRNMQENIKPDVSKLFESNPELANQVYGALGFKIKYYDKSWKDGSNVNKAKSFALKDKPSEIFELVEDKENGYYSVHFKTTKKDSLTNEEKQKLVQIVASNIPVGGKLSTWGTVTKGGFAGFNRFLQEGFIKTSETRDSGGNLIPVYEKINKSNFEQQAQQLYSQYLESLNKSNTNPILKGNQQEQLKKFTELQERLNNKEFFEGAKFAFESSKGLQEWGTQEQYNNYIARVSLGIIKNPSNGEYNYNSEVSDIVYHGSDKIFDKFIIGEQRTSLTDYLPKGVHFSNSLSTANSYSAKHGKIYASIIGIYKPTVIQADKEGDNRLTRTLESAAGYIPNTGKTNGEITELVENFVKNIKDNSDSVILKDVWDRAESSPFKPYLDTKFEREDYTNTYLVFDPEQTHILGSKQDIEGFKNWAANNKSKPGVSELFDENPELANSGKLTIYSKDFKRSSSFRKATQDKFISDTGLDRKIIQMLEDKFNIPVEIIDDINQAYAYTDGEKIFINIAKRADDDNTYVLKHAVHEFVHLMLGNMRLNNPEDYRILIEFYKKHSNLHQDLDLQKTEEELVEKLVDELGELKNVGTELDFEEELLNKISKGFGDLFDISDKIKIEKTGWLFENVESVIKKYNKDFAIMTSENFQLSQIKKHNRFLKEINLIKKEC